jgi:hypothetical protein
VGEQAVDVFGIVADLGVIPVVGVSGGAEYAGGERGRHLGLSGREDVRVGPPAGVDGFRRKQLDGGFQSAREIKADGVNHAAAADA